MKFKEKPALFIPQAITPAGRRTPAQSTRSTRHRPPSSRPLACRTKTAKRQPAQTGTVLNQPLRWARGRFRNGAKLS